MNSEILVKWLYAESISICVLLLILMFAVNCRNWKFRPINSLSCLYVVVILLASSDAVWIFTDGVKEIATFNKVMELCYNVLLPSIGWLWFNHTMDQTKMQKKTKFWCRTLSAIPTLATSFACIISQKTHFIFWVDDNGTYNRGPFYLIVMISCLAVLFAASIAQIIAAVKSTSIIERKKHIGAACFAIPVLISALIQNFLPAGSAPTTYFGILVALIFDYMSSLKNQITRDELTGVNNRYTIDNILEEAIHKQEKGSENLLWLVVCDLNDFKSINDTFGHLVGDQALAIAGKALSKVAEASKSVVGRTGGDEFFIIVESKDSEVARTIVTELPKVLKEMSSKEKYSLTISMGVALYEKGMSRKELVDHADQRMYAVKRSVSKHPR